MLLDDRIDALERDLRGRGSILIAFSGGVDSGVVAALAHRALGDRALAVTAAAETLAGRELDHARRLASEIGIRHEIVTYEELDNPEFVRNPSFRCYVCQGMRMDAMLELAARRGYAAVCDGTNASDPGPNRPGLRAIEERGVYSPLLAHGVDKATTREIGAGSRPLGVGPPGQRLPVLAHPARPGRHARQAAHDRGGGGSAARPRLHRRSRPPRRRSRPRRGRTAGAAAARRPVAGDRAEILALGFSAALYDPRGYRSGGADAPPSVSA